jgi:Uma2 family endonuclease
MASREPHHVFTYEEYLSREQETGLRHEFLDGAVYAMSGGTPEHARLIGEVAFAIRSAVDPTRCRVFPSDLKVQVAATGLTTYPDVALVCGEVVRASGDKNAVTNPKVLVEVLSASTEAYDRGEKWAHYRRIESLEAYVLVSQIPQRVEVYEKQANGEFVHRVAGPGERLVIAGVELTLEVDALYRAAL